VFTCSNVYTRVLAPCVRVGGVIACLGANMWMLVSGLRVLC